MGHMELRANTGCISEHTQAKPWHKTLDHT